MTEFEQRLRNSKSYNQILRMRAKKKDNLSDKEVIALKAQYLGTSIHSVQFNIEKMRLYKVKISLYRQVINIFKKILV